MTPAIRVENLSKRYRINHESSAHGRYRTLRDSLADLAKAPFQRLKNRGEQGRLEDFFALKDVSFDVQPGEVVGIIGRNGAGKSTLLKILSRITKPTSGRVTLNGRVGSLLEVGTGFHPELTGRENIFLNGSILGMKRAEISKQFDAIVDFSGVEKFLDTPVKRYSSGMYVRLAFAVAAHLEPEILVIDEVLAVGDAEFQKKCLGKMGEVAKEGRTVLFVSHNMVAVQTLCGRCILLCDGSLQAAGEVFQVVDQYLSLDGDAENERTWTYTEPASTHEEVRIVKVAIRPANRDDTSITLETPLELIIDYENLVEDAQLNVTIFLHRQDTTCAFASGSSSQSLKKGLVESRCVVPANLLNNGMYFLSVIIVKNSSEHLVNLDRVLKFEVLERRNCSYHGKWPGAVRPTLDWSVSNHVGAKP